MATFIFRRLFLLVFVMIGVSLLIFGLMYSFSPERRAAAFVSTPQMAKDIPVLIIKYGFDKPFLTQYFTWVKEILSLNFGYSLVASRSVKEAFTELLPITLELNLYACPAIIMFGIWMGTTAGRKPNTFFDHFSRFFSIVGWSLPTFLLALIMIMIFYGYIPSPYNFPPGILSDELTMLVRNADEFTRYTGLYTIDGLLNWRLDVTLSAFRHLILPVITETIVICAILMRVMRSGMLEEMSKDYIITAKAKGVDEKTISLKHAKKNALIPVVTIAGQLVAFLMEGSIAVEIIFNRQGLGWWLAMSATQLDMPVVMAMCLFMAVVFVSINLLVDILYAYIDPRIRLS